jgi:hypothetical protein
VSVFFCHSATFSLPSTANPQAPVPSPFTEPRYVPAIYITIM